MQAASRGAGFTPASLFQHMKMVKIEGKRKKSKKLKKLEKTY